MSWAVSETESSPRFTIRFVHELDLRAIHAIQEHYVMNTLMNFSYQPASFSDMQNVYEKDVRGQGFPYFVAVPTTDTSSSLSRSSPSVTSVVWGYGYVHGFRTRAAYQYTAELSIFCHPDRTNCGVGSALLTAIIGDLKKMKDGGACLHTIDLGAEHVEKVCLEDMPRAPEAVELEIPGAGGRDSARDVHQLLACMTVDPDTAQAEKLKRFYERHGFVETGCLKKVGFKEGKWLDTRYMQLEL